MTTSRSAIGGEVNNPGKILAGPAIPDLAITLSTFGITARGAI